MVISKAHSHKNIIFLASHTVDTYLATQQSYELERLAICFPVLCRLASMSAAHSTCGGGGTGYMHCTLYMKTAAVMKNYACTEIQNGIKMHNYRLLQICLHFAKTTILSKCTVQAAVHCSVGGLTLETLHALFVRRPHKHASASGQNYTCISLRIDQFTC